MSKSFEIYSGNGTQKMPDFNVFSASNGHTDYVVSPELKNAINVALMLGQPLLLTGEPGTGKTQLAAHVARHFSLDDEQTNLFIFNTKSTSIAKDLFYTYDALQHFQFVQNNKSILTNEEVEEKFIKYQALGAAIKSGKRCVVLIDEIDKAPRDLPNDILNTLENLEFEVPEINRIGKIAVRTVDRFRPILIMTSNSEKSLPDAFLRRCVFYHIPFPNQELLLKILKSKNKHYSSEEHKILTDHFQQIRQVVKRKRPSTAELLFWITVLERMDFNVYSLTKPKNLSPKNKDLLIGSYSALAKNQEDMKLIVDTLLY